MNELAIEKTMTVKELAEVLELDPRTVQLKVKELLPEIVMNGLPTRLTELQVTIVKNNLEKKFEVKTDLDKELLIHQALLIQQEKIKELKQINEAMRPKAEAFDTFLSADNSQPIGEVAKVLGTGQNKLFDFLRDENILFKRNGDNLPYQEYIDLGYFTVRVKPVHMGDKVVNKAQTLVTAKGVEYIRTRMQKAA